MLFYRYNIFSIAPNHKKTFHLLTQVSGVSLVPQADNPLPRLLVAKDIWRRALQAGMTSQPSAELHDRQYQLDLMQWSLSTGKDCWGVLTCFFEIEWHIKRLY